MSFIKETPLPDNGLDNGDKMNSPRETPPPPDTHTHTISDSLGDAVDNAVSGSTRWNNLLLPNIGGYSDSRKTELTWRYVYF